MQIAWRRVSLLGAALASVVAIALVAPLLRNAYDAHRALLAAEPDPIPATDAQQVDILRALLAATPGEDIDTNRGLVHFLDGMQRRVLLDHTVALRTCIHTQPEPPPGSGYQRVCSDPSVQVHVGEALVSTDYYYRDFPSKLRRELLLANARSTPLPDPGIPGVALVDENFVYFGESARASGVKIQRIAVSRAVLTHDQRGALVYAEQGGNFTTGHGAIIYLARTPRGWKVTRALSVWMQ